MDIHERARIRAGDPLAFGRLFDQYARAVYNHAFRLTGDWATAEDVVALTYLDTWRLRERVDLEGGSLRPWLLGIATNASRNIARSARRHQATLARLPRDEIMPDFADELVGRIDDTGRLATVRAALATLRRAEREVFALVVWSGLDYHGAAEALGVPVGTVRSRLARARGKLQKLTDAALSERSESSQHSARNREPRSGSGQTKGSRTAAVRPAQEETP
ncbi:RNA polymerase sigma factor [Streptomyces sp. NBC_01764]|uniref:RNA polymerase sigma factor n=1 Tax=Streptomyces sp. NBC_01764 TaxID=2975935 RepID=UPI00225439F2|nr:RNA polymerase sigma factor [Streptomyces sp. NBC_01764]MCX4410148.1 RNA polymerase sigma factor [Streptomyces sp. NBC_01764]